MTEILALGSAAAFGIGDFMGGLASRRGRPIRVTAIQQIASVVLLLPLIVFIPAPAVTTGDLVWGAVGGIFGMFGILALFSGLGRGPMGVVAPVTAVLAALVPLSAGIVSGERPSDAALTGMALGLLAIVAVSATGTSGVRIDRYAMLAAVVAGFSFGLFFVFVGRTSVDAGMWPLVTARAVSVPLITVLASLRGGVVPARPARPLAVASGIVDMAANGLFLAAAQRGLLSIASVLSALYPVGTVVLAWIVLGERLRSIQIGGVALAVTAVTLIGIGG